MAAYGSSYEKRKKENDRGIPVEKLLGYLRHAAEGLDYLHEEGIFHRDIKPENILLVGKIAKVADFGLGRLAANRQSTKTNFAGTSAYRAGNLERPRHCQKRHILAVTYAELLRRWCSKATPSMSSWSNICSHSRTSIRSPSRATGHFRGLAKEPSDRYATCSEFVAELNGAISDLGSLPATGPRPQSSTSVGGGRKRSAARTPETKWTTPVVPERPLSNGRFRCTRNGAETNGDEQTADLKLPSSHIEIDVQEPELARPLA